MSAFADRGDDRRFTPTSGTVAGWAGLALVAVILVVVLADVRKVAVRAVTWVYTDERRFDGVAVGRPVRSLRPGRPSRKRPVGLPGLGATYAMDANATPKGPQGDLDANGMADFVTEQILLAAERARSAPHDDRPARRSWARLELAALTLLVAGFVVTVLI